MVEAGVQGSGGRFGRWKSGLAWGLAGAVLLLLLVPVWLYRLPPSVDYPLHAARAFVLSRPPGSGGVLEYYQPYWIPVPNLGVDIVLSSMMRVLPPREASCVFLTLVVLVLFGGAAAWSRALGHTGPALALPAVALGDTWFRMGFVNYVLGVGLAAWGMAWFVRSRGAPRARLAGQAAATFAALAVVHLMAALVFGFLAAVEAAWGGPDRRIAARWLPWAVPGGLLAAAAALAALGKTPWNWHAKALAGSGLLRVFEGGVWQSPAPVLALAGLVLLAWAAWPSRVGRIAGWALVCAVLVGPSFAAGSAFASERLTLPLVLVLAVYAGSGARAQAAALGSLACFFLAAAAQFPSDLRAARDAKTVTEEVLRRVGPGDTVVTFEQGLPVRPTTSRLHLHLADWAVFEGVFVPQLFAKALQQPMRFTGRARPFKEFQGQDPIMRRPTAEDVQAVSRLQAALDPGAGAFLLVYGEAGGAPPGVEVVWASESPVTTLYRVLPP